MSKRAYALYVSTFQDTVDALRAGDEPRLRALCSEVASRGGIESTVSLLAMSDAERGVPLRSRTKILGQFWRATLTSGLDDRAHAATTPMRAA